MFLLVCLMVGSGLLSQNLRYGLVFYAPFDGSTVNLVDWVKPRSTAVALVENKFGEAHQAVAFDGEKSLLDYGKIVNLREKDLSLSCWVKISSDQDEATFSSLAAILQKNFNTDPAANAGFIVCKPNANIDGSLFSGFSNVSSIETNRWHHLLVTRNENELKLYIGGQLLAHCFLNDDDVLDFHPNQALFIGGVVKEDSRSSKFFKGALDELRIYNRCLTDREIQALYQDFLGEEEVATDQTINQEINTSLAKINVTAYPNPATHILNLKFKEASSRSIEVVDESGRNLLFRRSENAFTQINVAGFPPGTYFLRIKSEAGIIMHKFIKTGVVLP